MPTNKRKATPKPRVVTDATKAKLPLPANHPQKRKRNPRTKEQNAAVVRALTDNADGSDPYLTNAPLRALATFKEAERRAIPCGEDVVTVTFYDAPRIRVTRVPPPDTSAYPWPLKFAWWLDGWLAKLARRFA